MNDARRPRPPIAAFVAVALAGPPAWADGGDALWITGEELGGAVGGVVVGGGLALAAAAAGLWHLDLCLNLSGQGCADSGEDDLVLSSVFAIGYAAGSAAAVLGLEALRTDGEAPVLLPALGGLLTSALLIGTSGAFDDAGVQAGLVLAGVLLTPAVEIVLARALAEVPLGGAVIVPVASAEGVGAIFALPL